MELFANKIEKQIASYQQELIETHYREVDNMYRQIRGWRHDYRNHIQTMKAYAAAGDWDAIQNYLDLLDTDLQTVDTVIKTGNPMTDAILNSKISLAKAKGIEVAADAHIPVRLKSSEIDLCCILGNLFDNAIEASMKLPEDKRLIRVYMDMKNTQLYISFTNFTAGKKMQYEKHPALHLLHQFYRREENAEGGRAVPQHQGRGAWLWPCSHRRHRGAAGRIHQPQQRGRCIHH